MQGPLTDRRQGRRRRGAGRRRRPVVLDVMSDEQRDGAARAAARRTGRPRGPVRPARLADPGLRRRVGQGRRGQVQRHREPGRRDGRRGPAGGRPGRRRLRLLGPAHAGRRRARPTRVDDMILPPIAHDVKVISIGMFVPGNQPVVWRGPDAAPGARAVPHRRLLGRPRRPAARPAARHRRHRDLDGAAAARRRDPRRDDAAGGRRRGRRAGRVDRAADEAARRRRRREHVVARHCPTAAGMELFGSGGGRRWPSRCHARSGRRVPLLGQLPLDVRLREGGDAGIPSCSPTPTPPPPWRSAGSPASSAAVLAAWPAARWV